MSAVDELRKILEECGVTLDNNEYSLEWYSDNGETKLIAKANPCQTTAKCKWELIHRGPLYDKWRCSSCGYEFAEPVTDKGYTELEPNFCPNCGRRIET